LFLFDSIFCSNRIINRYKLIVKCKLDRTSNCSLIGCQRDIRSNEPIDNRHKQQYDDNDQFDEREPASVITDSHWFIIFINDTAQSALVCTISPISSNSIDTK
jgi:hypothetical protein